MGWGNMTLGGKTMVDKKNGMDFHKKRGKKKKKKKGKKKMPGDVLLGIHGKKKKKVNLGQRSTLEKKKHTHNQEIKLGRLKKQ